MVSLVSVVGFSCRGYGLQLRSTRQNAAPGDRYKRQTLAKTVSGDGSTRALTNAAGTVEAEFFYDAFGELQTATGNLASEQNLLTDYLYTGQQYDADLDLYSLRARYYDTAQGRFLSRDTYPYNYQNPFELNRYVYTANNPTTYVDPSGYSIFENKLLRKFVGGASAVALPFVAYGVAQVVIDATLALVLQTEYTPASAAQSFIEGGTTGIAGLFAAKLILKTKPFAQFLLGLLADTGIGTVWDTFVNQVELGTAAIQNFLGSIAGKWLEEVLNRLTKSMFGEGDVFGATPRSPIVYDKMDLGTEIRAGGASRFIPHEADAGERLITDYLQLNTNVTELKRYHDQALDWIDNLGHTYDLVGLPSAATSRYKLGNPNHINPDGTSGLPGNGTFLRSITDHFDGKLADYIVIDTTNLRSSDIPTVVSWTIKEAGRTGQRYIPLGPGW